ncbi:hypothetical protein AC579_5169 [Pseudocercospora musae]|uniref:Secreted protein n=1 Tax=Pseudocercospora musae TaxID=113226 RepID=A0A139HZU9_9PEZI|nr:hypothetical protein AC579_5169 [Pseudocercospora musae]
MLSCMLKAALIACISLGTSVAAAPLTNDTTQLNGRAVDKANVNSILEKQSAFYMGTNALGGCTSVVIYSNKGCFLAHLLPDEQDGPTYEWKQVLEAGMCDGKARVAFDGGRAVIVGSKSGGYEFEWQINQIKEWLDGYNIRWTEEPYLIDYGEMDEDIARKYNAPPENFDQDSPALGTILVGNVAKGDFEIQVEGNLV